jgi:hypothetical protein
MNLLLAIVIGIPMGFIISIAVALYWESVLR